MAAIEYSEAKFTELLLHVAQRLRDDPAGGAIKLNKVLFFAEFAHMRTHGRPITGAVFQRLEMGPAPRRLKPVRAKLIEAGDADLVEEPVADYTLQRLVPLRDADLSLFDEEELACVERALQQLRGRTATSISAISHRELGWQLTEDFEDIPYETAFLRQPEVTDAVRQRVRELASEHLS